MGRAVPSPFLGFWVPPLLGQALSKHRQTRTLLQTCSWRPSSFCTGKTLLTPPKHPRSILFTFTPPFFCFPIQVLRMDVVLRELKREEERALRARVQKSASRLTRCRPSSPSFAASPVPSIGPSVSPAADPAVSCLQDCRLGAQPQQSMAATSPVMLHSSPLGPRVDRDLHRIDSEVLSVRKAALSSLHELCVPSAAKPLQV